MSLDFMIPATRSPKRNEIEIYPKFIVRNTTKDLMVKGSDFYAIWDERTNLWSTSEDTAISLIDRELDLYYEANKDKYSDFARVSVAHLWDADTGMITKFHLLVQKHLRDNWHPLDERLIFADQETSRTDYASKKLPYSMSSGEAPGYTKLVETLYAPEERHKFEWAIGSIINGDSRWIQKFLVFYGEGGTGKSTILNIIDDLFEGYTTAFKANALGNSAERFALEPFKNNPLVAIQQDGDLSRIEDNSRLNSLVSHETMLVEEKYKSTYPMQFKTFLFMGTNKPVKITDAKSGLIRRLIDVHPTGDKLSGREYHKAVKAAKFELGAIASHCLGVYEEDPEFYDDYVPFRMLGASNDFYNFVFESYSDFKKNDGISLRRAWEIYNNYCKDSNIEWKMTKTIFAEELKSYFYSYEVDAIVNGRHVKQYYKGFRTDKFEEGYSEKKSSKLNLIDFSDSTSTILDDALADCPAQYATDSGIPAKAWCNVRTNLSDIDRTKLHYVKVPLNHIVIDFDIRDTDGTKCFYKNVVEASKFPDTYAELSKSGGGIHLHYIYDGDVSQLADKIAPDIEIKVFKGDMALRRKFTKCNGHPIATISSNLPIKKKEPEMINQKQVVDQKHLRNIILKAMRKEIDGCGSTKQSIDFIKHMLDEAYASGMTYDLTSLENDIIGFALQSTNNSDYCLAVTKEMKFASEDNVGEPEEDCPTTEKPIAFYDVEIFPNLFIVCYKVAGPDVPVVKMINPSAEDVETVISAYRLIGFNNLDYDNHMIYACMIGYSVEQLYELSQNIIVHKRKDCKFGPARHVSYSDAFDISVKKQGLKKWEIELGLFHHEFEFPWDEPLDPEYWNLAADYCADDVLATEAVWNERAADVMAREIQIAIIKNLHGITNVSLNNKTNELSTKLIFGRERNPQSAFNWRDLSKPVGSSQYEEYLQKFGDDYHFRVFNDKGLPEYRDYIPGETLPDGWSILPFFPKYSFNALRGSGRMSVWSSVPLTEEEIAVRPLKDDIFIKEGGLAWAAPGYYGGVLCEDVASQHPHSLIAEAALGPVYTKRFKDLVDIRIAIKHKDFESAGNMLGGAIREYLNEQYAKDLSGALKIVINSIYGLTSASFDNAFKDPHNIDNIVAKRGNLTMCALKEQVEARGYRVAHIKTDCIKIPDADDYIKSFVEDFGKEYGYTFEVEEEFDKFCIVNDAEYVGRLKDGTWIATGTKFIRPVPFKTLFSKEDLVLKDYVIPFSVTSTKMYLDYDENLPEGKHAFQFVGKVGAFLPVKPGRGGGRLYRQAIDKEGNYKYDSVSGTKGYRWMEAYRYDESKYDDIDMSYYDDQIDTIKEEIGKYVDFDEFVSEQAYSLPFTYTPCAPWEAAHNEDELPPWDIDDDTFKKR